jgi:hypothetical protein
VNRPPIGSVGQTSDRKYFLRHVAPLAAEPNMPYANNSKAARETNHVNRTSIGSRGRAYSLRIIEAKSGTYAPIAGDVYNSSHRFSPVQCYRRSSPVQRFSLAGSARWAELRPGAEVRRAACRCNTQAGRHRLSPVRRCSVGYHWLVAGGRPNFGQAKYGGGLKPVSNSGRQTPVVTGAPVICGQ